MRRHNPRLEDRQLSPFTSATGSSTSLQTHRPSVVSDIYLEGIPLCTLSTGLAHRAQAGQTCRAYPEAQGIRHIRPSCLLSHQPDGQEDLYEWLRPIPTDCILDSWDSRCAQRRAPGSPSDVESIDRADLWTGVCSRFSIEGVPVSVETCCHQTMLLHFEWNLHC